MLKYQRILARVLPFLLAAGCAHVPSPSELSRAEEQYKLGYQRLHSKDYPVAIRHLNECLKLQPDHQKCQWQLGWARFMERDWTEAQATWKRLERLNPDFPELQSALEKADLHCRTQAQMQLLRTQAPAHAPNPPAHPTLLTLKAVGDVMIGSDFPAGMLPPPEGPKPLAQAKDLLSGSDLVFGNFEGSLCDGGKTVKCASAAPGKCFAFRTPSKIAVQLKEAGFNLASLANNHNGDFGEACRIQSERILSRLGIRGSGRAGTVSLLKKKGLKISMVAFHSSPLCNSTNDLPAAEELVRHEKKRSDIVIVSFHGGAEGFGALHVPGQHETFVGEDRGDVLAFARRMIDAGASLVLGHGPHVPRAIELYQGHLIAYSLGNFATYKLFNLSGFAGIAPLLEVRLNEKGLFAGGKIIPIRQIGEGMPVADDREMAIDLIRYLSKTDFPETGFEVAQDGELIPPPGHSP